MTSLELVTAIVNLLDDKKAEDIRVLRVEDVSILGEYFSIADGSNITHVRALVDEVEFQTKKMGRSPKRIEKDSSSNWIVLDYADVIVHLFYKPTREFYDLERLWADGQEIPVDTLLK